MPRWIAVFAALLMPAFAAAQVNAIPPAPHLLVKGHAEGHYVPDRFVVSLQVMETNMAPDLARQQVETHMTQIFAALEKNGAMRGKTSASTLQIEPKTEYRDDRRVFVGTRVSRSVHATFDNLDKLRGFLGQLKASEAVQVSGVDVQRSDADALKLELRKRAMANSQDAAKQIASAYGMSIKGVYSVSEVAPDFDYGIRAGSWGNSRAAEGPVAPPPPPDAIAVAEMSAVGPELRVGTIDLEQNIYAVYLTTL